jgi:RsiW-degrading membrane proteinase PrsW (M82 family)
MAPAGEKAVLDARSFGRTPVPFLIALAVSSLIAIVALVIVVQGGQVSALIGLVLALLPVPVVLAGVLYLDRLEPEPISVLLLVFGAGAGAAALIGLVGHTLSTGLITTPELGPEAGRLISTTFGAALGGAIVAETLKGAVLVALLKFRRGELDGAHDGVVYASMTGLGFALIANLYAYLHAEHGGLDALVSAFVGRGVLAPLWDPLFSSMIGLGVSYAAMRRGRSGLWAVGLGWVVAVALHTMWDESVNAGPAHLALVYLILLGVLAVLMGAVVADRRRIIGLISGYLPEFAAAGVATEQDIQMLGRLRWRRQARDWARLHRGLSGQRAMSEYQLAATELALAANRAGRGLMPQRTFGARRENSLSLMRAALPVLRDDPQRLQPPPWAPHGGSAFTPRRPSRDTMTDL